MSQKTIVQLVDDVDGGEAEESVIFGLDGRFYEIDLNGKNAEALRAALEPYVTVGRVVKGSSGPAKVNGATRKAPRPAKKGWTTADRTAMQAFAKKKKMTVPADRGRIARAVIDAWVDAGRPA